MLVIATIAAYLGIGVFLLATVIRVIYWIKMPIHMRWELYPVAHEPGRAHYGGSYLEESDWWKKPRQTSLLGEIKAMFMEIVFLVALREHNRSLWWRSFPFHFGLYLVIACTALMVANGIVVATIPTLLDGNLGMLVHYGIVGLGFAGLALSLIGALGLLQRRLFDPALRDFTSRGDIFNLVLFVLTFGLALLHALWTDQDFARSTSVMIGLVSFNPSPLTGSSLEIGLTTGTVVMLGFMVAYIPLTHMSHYIGKYFAYHAIRWNDAPNLRGGSQEAQIKEVLGYRVDWSGPHIQGQGKKTWEDLATEDMKK